jgi:uncharacterized membrane protein
MGRKHRKTSNKKKPILSKNTAVAPSKLKLPYVTGLIVLSLSAFLLSSYLAWVSFSQTGPVGCGVNSGCGEILKSRWSRWLGVPVSLPAAILYGTVTGLLFSLKNARNNSNTFRNYSLLLFLVSLAGGSALWFLGLQVFVLKKYCFYCLGIHSCGATLACSLWFSFARTDRPRKKGSNTGPSMVFFGSPYRLGVSVIGLLAMMAIGQIVGKAPVGNTVEKVDQLSSIKLEKRPEKSLALEKEKVPTSGRDNSIVARKLDQSPESEDLSNPVSRTLSLHSGKFILDLDVVPMLGSAAAEYTLVSLFDYTCHHCRDLHLPLKEMFEAFHGKVAVISLPMPIDSNCNRLVKKTRRAHLNSCNYARLGLAVWVSDRNIFEEFNDWVFAPPRPPALNLAYQYASKLVGTELLNESLQDPWVVSQIKQDVEIYAMNYHTTHKDAMPQLIIGQSISAGSIKESEKLIKLVSKEFGIQPGTGSVNK